VAITYEATGVSQLLGHVPGLPPESMPIAYACSLDPWIWAPATLAVFLPGPIRFFTI